MSQKQLAKMRMKEIGFILQATNLVPFLTVKQQFHLLKSYKNVFRWSYEYIKTYDTSIIQHTIAMTFAKKLVVMHNSDLYINQIP